MKGNRTVGLNCVSMLPTRMSLRKTDPVARGLTTGPVGTVEGRYVDRRQSILGKHASERVGERDIFRSFRMQIERLRKARVRFPGGDDFKKLLLPRGLAHFREQRGFLAGGFLFAAHGKSLMSTMVPAG